MVNSAWSTASSGGKWFVGSFEQTLPPMVPRFRTWTSAIVRATSARIGRAAATSGESTMAAYVVIAPIVRVPLPFAIPRRASIPFRSTTSSGDATRVFITFTRLCPPASARASSRAASSFTASSTESGRA